MAFRAATKPGGRHPRWTSVAVVLLALVTAGAARSRAAAGQDVSGQQVADIDYENLSFRGIAPEWGYLWPTKAEPTYTLGTRVDLGYLGPGIRLIPGIAYWSSPMKDKEVRRLERNVDDLVRGQVDPGSGDTQRKGDI